MFASDPYFQSTPFPLAIHFTHEEPSYRAAYDQLTGRPFSAYLEEQGVECA